MATESAVGGGFITTKLSGIANRGRKNLLTRATLFESEPAFLLCGSTG